MEDVVMTDAVTVPKEQEKVEKNPIYNEFKKCLISIQKSIPLKDLKTLSMTFRLINKFRRGFKDEDFAYLNEIYLKPHFVFTSFKYNLALPKNFEITPKSVENTKNLPEIVGFVFLIFISKLIDLKEYDEAGKGLEFLIDFLKKHQTLTVQFLQSRSFYFLSLVCEKLGKMESLIKELYSAYRSSCIQMDEVTQVTLINCIIRYYLNNNAIEQARSFLSKIKYQENISTNEDARYFYYVGRIEAIQMNYSDAFKHLNNSFRKAPEKCAFGFKNVITKLIIVVQLLMGDIPSIKSMMSLIQNREFVAFKPYLDLVKAVKNGNLDEYRKVLSTYEKDLEKDGNLTLVHRIRHVVIKAGLRKINLSYSRISIKDIVEKLKLENEKDAEFIIGKAIRDGVFLAKINHDEGYVQSMEIKDIYSTFQPQKSYQSRIAFLNKIYNDCQQAMKFSEKAENDKKEKKSRELEEDDDLDKGLEEL